VRLIAQSWQLPTADDISIPLRQEIAQSMLHHGFWEPNTPPVIDEETLSNAGISPIGIYTLTHPRLYYALSAVWLWPWLNLPVDGQLYLLRMFSIILNLVVVLATYFAVRVLYPYQKWLALAVASFVVFQPVHTDIMSSVNNDTLVNAIGGLFFLVAAWIFKKGLDLRKIILLVLLIILGILTKTTTVVLILSLPLILLFYLWREGHHKWFVGILGFLILILVGSSVLWQIEVLQEWVVQFGDAIGKYFRITFSGTFEALNDPEFRQLPLKAAPVVYKSFWGAFGWRHIWLNDGWYVGLATISALAILGLIVMGIRGLTRQERRLQNRYQAPFLGYGIGAVILAILAAVFRSLAVQGLSPYLSHGRYVFIAMVPFAMLITLGLRAWTSPIWRRKTGILFVLMLIVYDAVCFWGTVVPFYH
jgi:hypothetical protein